MRADNSLLQPRQAPKNTAKVKPDQLLFGGFRVSSSDFSEASGKSSSLVTFESDWSNSQPSSHSSHSAENTPITTPEQSATYHQLSTWEYQLDEDTEFTVTTLYSHTETNKHYEPEVTTTATHYSPKQNNDSFDSLVARTRYIHTGSEQKRRHHLKQFTKEVSLHRELDHPNVVECLGCQYSSDEQQLILTIFTHYAGKDLLTQLKPLCPSLDALQGLTPEQIMDQRQPLVERLINFTHQMMDALIYLRKQGILHRDIKPDNIRVNAKAQLKLIDFGLSVNITQTKPKGSCGTGLYMSPEAQRGEEQSYPSDMCSTGLAIARLAREVQIVDIDYPGQNDLSSDSRAPRILIRTPATASFREALLHRTLVLMTQSNLLNRPSPEKVKDMLAARNAEELLDNTNEEVALPRYKPALTQEFTKLAI